MTIASTVTKKIYDADGVTRDWPITMETSGISSSEIKVYLVDEDGVSTLVTANYDVDLTALSVEYPTVVSGLDPIESPNQILLVRELGLTQPTDYKNQGDVPAETIEEGLDRLTEVAQQLQEQVDRSVKSDISENSGLDYEDFVAVKADCDAAQAAAEAAQGLAEAAQASAEAVLTDAGFVAVAADLIGDDNIGTVADNISDVNDVADNVVAIAAVNANKTNIDAVNANKTNIDAVAGNATNINAVNANKTNIDAVAGNATNITTTAGNNTNITTCATNISAIQAAPQAAIDASNYATALKSTSTTSLAIGTGSKTFTTQASKQFAAGLWVLATSDADPANYMHGQVTSYSGTTLVVNVTDIGGSGTLADWTISVSGTRGATGADEKVKNVSGDASAGYLAEKLAALYPSLYQRDQKWALKTPYSTAANRYTILTPNKLSVDINGTVYFLTAQAEIDLSSAANWDTTSPTNYTTAANRAGKDFYIYACVPVSGSSPKIVLSANSTTPSGYTSSNSRKIGGFHGLCVAVGTISGHTLTDFAVGDVLPASIWDLVHRPVSNPEGMVYSEGINKWVDIYLASGTGTSTASVYGGTISDTRDWNDFVDDGGAVKKRMLDDGEFQVVAAGSNEATNITGSADPGTAGGHVDTASRRMISNIGVEDACGALWQWLSDQSSMYSADGAGWYDLPGDKGQLLRPANTNDVKLVAGGYWNNSVFCGSRGRVANSCRWLTSSTIGCRFCAEPV